MKMSKEERAELEARLAADDDADDDYEVEIGSGGDYARVPYAKAKRWLGEKFGIDLDLEPKQDPEAKPAEAKGKADDTVKRFAGGRRIG